MKSSYFFVDLGDEISVSSTLYAAQLFATSFEEKIHFCTATPLSVRPENFPLLNLIVVESPEMQEAVMEADVVLDFTDPSKAQATSSLVAMRSDKLHLKRKQFASDNVLDLKMEFIEMCTGAKELIQQVRESQMTPVLTYSPLMAAQLNRAGVPTIELCYRHKKPGSFLPGSLVILGDSFTMLQKNQLDLIFEFYHLGKIDEVFQNRSILETDWDIMYYKIDQMKGSILAKKHPISPTESFLDHFFKGFLAPQSQRTFSIEHLLRISQKMDTIDMEMTLDFIKRILRHCNDDLECNIQTYQGSYWNLVRPYLDCRRGQASVKVQKSITQAMIGLDLFRKIQDRQRKSIHLH